MAWRLQGCSGYGSRNRWKLGCIPWWAGKRQEGALCPCCPHSIFSSSILTSHLPSQSVNPPTQSVIPPSHPLLPPSQPLLSHPDLSSLHPSLSSLHSILSSLHRILSSLLPSLSSLYPILFSLHPRLSSPLRRPPSAGSRAAASEEHPRSCRCFSLPGTLC